MSPGNVARTYNGSLIAAMHSLSFCVASAAVSANAVGADIERLDRAKLERTSKALARNTNPFLTPRSLLVAA